MKRNLPPTFGPVLAVVLGLLLGGCGGGTKTVSVASAPPVARTGASTAPRTTTTATTPTSRSTTPATTPTTTSEGTSSPTTTRTAPAPAFTHQGTSAEGLSAAEAVLRARGFTASATSEYHPNQTLRVLIGTRIGSGEGSGQQAFFFVDERYIGTDAKQPSASIHVVSQSDTEVTLAYALHGSGGGAGQATVRFQLDNGQLTPLDPIPSAASRQ